MIQVRFAACGHYAEFKTVDDRYGLEELCAPCGKYQSVWEVWRDQWHSNCADCVYHRTHGQAKVYAERAATAHTSRHPSHRVSVAYYSDAPSEAKMALAKIREENRPQPLPDLPPF